MATVIAPPTLPVVRPRRRDVWRSLPPKAKVGAVILLVFVVVAIIGPWVAPYAPRRKSTLPGQILAAPSSQHLLPARPRPARMCSRNCSPGPARRS